MQQTPDTRPGARVDPLSSRCMGPDLGTCCGAFGIATILRAAASATCCVLALEAEDTP